MSATRGARQVDRGQVDLAPGALQQVAGLAARRRAGIEHPLAGLRIEQEGGELRAGVLHRDESFGETRQLGYGHRAIQSDAGIDPLYLACSNILRGEPREVGRRG